MCETVEPMAVKVYGDHSFLHLEKQLSDELNKRKIKRISISERNSAYFH